MVGIKKKIYTPYIKKGLSMMQVLLSVTMILSGLCFAAEKSSLPSCLPAPSTQTNELINAIAAKNSDSDSILDIIEKTTRINDTDTHGNTALHHAVQHKNSRTVYFLCKKNTIDCSLKNSDGKTALDLTVDQKPHDKQLLIISQMLMFKDPTTITGKFLRKWAKLGYYTYAPIPCNATIINEVSKKNKTALIIAAEKNHIATSESLLASGANLSQTTLQWQTAETITSNPPIRALFTHHKQALLTIYTDLKSKKISSYADVNLDNPDTLPTHNISLLLQALIPKIDGNTCFLCRNHKKNCIPCHVQGLCICMPCVKKNKNKCSHPDCKKTLIKFTCLACHKIKKHGLVCPNYALSYLPQACSSCTFPWLLAHH